MSKITPAEIKRIAELAHIEVSDSEVTSLVGELSNIVGFVEQLQSIDVEDVAPTDQVTGLEDVTRPDVVRASELSRDAMLANAPQTKDGYIVVKRVLN